MFFKTSVFPFEQHELERALAAGFLDTQNVAVELVYRIQLFKVSIIRTETIKLQQMTM